MSTTSEPTAQAPAPLELSYYPGCAGHGTAREYDGSARELCSALGIELIDLPDWTCCGASSAHALVPDAAEELAGRNLSIADQEGRDLAISCAACFNRLRSARHHAATRAPGAPTAVAVRSLLDILSEPQLLERLAAARTNPLDGLPVVPYYGCLLTRPPAITGATRPDAPLEMDRFLAALGAEVREWPYKTRCCGGGLTLPKPEMVTALCDELVGMARRGGAAVIVTACPMCFANLDTRQSPGGEESVPVAYFTELGCLALGLPGTGAYLRRQVVDPVALRARLRSGR